MASGIALWWSGRAELGTTIGLPDGSLLLGLVLLMVGVVALAALVTPDSGHDARGRWRRR
jgi:hypothetical protein